MVSIQRVFPACDVRVPPSYHSRRAREGAFKGEVGTALRVVTSRDEGRTSKSVLVSFPAGGADYLSADAPEKAEEWA
jgi:hypothetical protein